MIIYKGHSINKGILYLKTENLIFQDFSLNENYEIFGIAL